MNARSTRSARAGEKLTQADALAYLKRFPAQGNWAVAGNLAIVVAGNALVFWLVASGKLRAAHLIALVMAEALLLVVLANLSQRLVPRRDWLEQPKPWRERIGVLAFALVWIGFVYALTLFVLKGHHDFLRLLSSPAAWFAANLHWPLAATAALGLFHAASDLIHYRRNGGPFHSTVSPDAMARYLTLFLGGIPFAMPFFAVMIGGVKGVEYVAKQARVSPEKSVMAGIGMSVVAIGSFWVVTRLIQSEVTGWAIGFVFAKLIAEILVACIPLVMAHVAKSGP